MSEIAGSVDAQLIQRTAEEAAAQLDPRAGNLLRVVLLRTSTGQPDQLIVIAHHLIVDGVSWRILLPDLHKATDAAREHRSAKLGRRESRRRHAGVLAEFGASGTLRSELDYWKTAAGITGTGSARMLRSALVDSTPRRTPEHRGPHHNRGVGSGDRSSPGSASRGVPSAGRRGIAGSVDVGGAFVGRTVVGTNWVIRRR